MKEKRLTRGRTLYDAPFIFFERWYEMNPKLKENIRESLASVLPISLIVLLVSVILVPMELGHIMLFLTGAVMLIIGMGLFQLGAEMTMTPLGEGIGVQLSKMKTVIAVLVID